MSSEPSQRKRPQRYRPVTLATYVGISSLALPTISLYQLCRRAGSLIPVIWTGLISGVTFLCYGYDKMQARNNEWRMRESTLHTLELLGGWPGALLGQHYFQHKTKKKSFQVGFWGIVLGWQIIWFALLRGKAPSAVQKVLFRR